MIKFENNLFTLVQQCHTLNMNLIDGYFTKILPLSQISCKIKGMGQVPIAKTPHFKFFHKKNIYEKNFPSENNDLGLYFKKFYPNEYSSKMLAASHLLGNDFNYLSDRHQNSAIVVDGKNCVLDGNLRAARLLSLGATHAVVIELRPNDVNFSRVTLPYDKNSNTVNTEMGAYLNFIKDYFKEWYSPVELGPFRIPKKVYPDFHEVWNYDESEGIRNWDSIIRHILPNVSEKKILDIGSNIGLYSLELARMGATVCGVDRGPRVFQSNNYLLGTQSVPNQAYATRNIYEVFYAERYTKVAFAELDLMMFDFSSTNCDIFFSCRVLYHLGKNKMEEVINQASKNIPEIILQSNEGHRGKLGKISSMEFHIKTLKRCGYKIKKEYSPFGSFHPIVYASK